VATSTVRSPAPPVYARSDDGPPMDVEEFR
jgi:hypothetical protein